MNLFRRLINWKTKKRAKAKSKEDQADYRQCRFETMESRRMLNADPIFLGATYYETDTGSDIAQDTFEIAFVGGSDTTKMTSVSVNLNNNVYFDTVANNDPANVAGVSNAHGFQFDAQNSNGINSQDVLNVSVADGGRSLNISLANFEKGDKLVFTIDVDHALSFTDDPIASGAEFELSTVSASFTDPNYNISPQQGPVDLSNPGGLAGTEHTVFWNSYDSLVGSTQLVGLLRPDNFQNSQGNGQADRTAGGIVGYNVAPKPITIAGTVFHDRNMNLTQDTGDEGIAGTTLSLLYKKNVGDTYQAVIDGNGQAVTTTTNATGDYSFGVNDGLKLLPGYYRVVETQPTGFGISVGAIPGTVQPTDGQSFGVVDPSDPTNVITDIHIPFGDRDAVNYDFAEANPISIGGNVHLSDADGNCHGPGDPNHNPLAGVKIYLISDTGVVHTTQTDANGDYLFAGPQFANLLPGNYTILEVLPTGLFDGSETVGNVQGQQRGTVDSQLTEITLANGTKLQLSNVVQASELGRLDAVKDIQLLSGEKGVQYNFCEHQPGSLSGHVYIDLNDDGVRDTSAGNNEGPVQTPPTYQAVQNVLMTLLDDQGNVVATTTTDAQGFYKFDNLKAGTYTVKEGTVNGYFDGKETVGTIDGTADGTYTRTPDANGVLKDSDEITQITLGHGQHGINYDFGEIPPSTLSGFVYNDANNNGVFDTGETPFAGIEMELRVTFNNSINGVMLSSDYLLDSSVLDSQGRYIVLTDANGQYQFTGLRGGVIDTNIPGQPLGANYTVYQNTQPTNFVDGLDTPGTTGGKSDNALHPNQTPNDTFSQSLINTHTNNGARTGDLLFQIPLAVGQTSAQNNFGEIENSPPPPPPPTPRPPAVVPPPPPSPQAALGSTSFVQPLQVDVGFGAIDTIGGADYTWHLSVLNAGNPRGEEIASHENPWHSASLLDRTNWQPDQLREGQWTLQSSDENGVGPVQVREVVFGVHGGIPVVGDFNGDGVDELAIFYQGEWFLDLNANGEWDQSDLWAKLGAAGDLPVVGDWDGDGKDDIGIFGPAWRRDPTAIEHEPGLPDPENFSNLAPKNLPPKPADATSGERLMKLTNQGHTRSDVIDHVFRYGISSDIPVTGDWNGDGINGIGIFRAGRWSLDVDGDGRWSAPDIVTQFGQAGDIPIVGDFDGNGVDEIGVYRAGKWIIDIDGDQRFDEAADKVFELGGAGDTPVVGDWNGDGIDDPGLYRAIHGNVADRRAG